MKNIRRIGLLLLMSLAFNCKTELNKSDSYAVESHKDSNGFSYETVTNDPTGLRLYTLDNGFKVYLSQNTDEPKIQTYIAVRAGSNYDPKESTGLAHYLEHMVFKGTSKIGTLDWEKEKVFLDKISDLYEQHKAETDPDKKIELYKKIDATSLEASNYSVANEYDKMIGSLGATGTNAYTWYEQTVYTMVAIHNYFDTYYVPNNMAMVLVGDLEFDSTIKKINESFGTLEKKVVEHPTLPEETPITAPIVKEVFGPTTENVTIGFRSRGIGTEDEKLMTLCDMILANGNAGLIDLNLNQKQVVQNAGCSPSFHLEYGFHRFSGTPKEGQTLDEVKDLILAQIDLLKKGEFEDWLIEATVNDLKLSQTKEYENSTALAGMYVNAFINRENWIDRAKFLDNLKSISKQEVVNFANRFYKDNYVLVYKRKGEDNSIVKVANPGITPVNLNRGKVSPYMQDFNAVASEPLQPKFVDYKSDIKKAELDNGIKVAYIENELNDLFDLNIIFDMGNDSDNKLGFAVDYLEYLGTDTLTDEDIKKEFYKLGIKYYVSSSAEKVYVGLSGLKENLPKGLELLENLWANAVPNQEAYNKYVDQILKDRQDGKTQKGNILNGLMNYGKYGEKSRLRNIMQFKELSVLDPQELVDIVKDLKTYKQRVFYYGKDVDGAIAALNKYHKVPDSLKAYKEATVYTEQETGGNVYFVDYDMVQSEMLFLAKGEPFKAENMAASTLFNTYFGGGLSSIVFQEIRESKSLAYSAWSNYSNASKKENSNYVMAYIGTQANKMPQAVDAMMELMNDMPEAEEQFMAAKEATLKKIAAQRITKSSIFWNYERLKKLGIDNDNREAIYKAIQNMTIEDLRNFFNANVKGEDYNVMVIGNKKDIDFKALSKLGDVKEMDIDYLFNYEKSEQLKS